MDSNNNKRPRFSSSPPLSLSYNKQDVITMEDFTPTTSSGGLGGVTNTNTVVNDLVQKIKTLTEEVEGRKKKVEEKEKEVETLTTLQRNAVLVPNSPPFTQQHKEALDTAIQERNHAVQERELTIQERNHAEQQLKELLQQLHPGKFRRSRLI
jgi:uncharacterized coiled-coil DUF342 family protein